MSFKIKCRDLGKKWHLGKFGLIIISLTFICIKSLATDIPAGSVSGTWIKANSPYYILGEITIPNDSILTIEPGVNVIFEDHYKFNVQGRLLAVGTEEDTIRFSAENKQTGWHGIRFYKTPATNDTSKFIYCSFKYGNANTGSGLDRCGGAMLISYFDKVLVTHCLFDSNKQSGEGWDPPEADGGIYIYRASAKITKSTFSNNVGSKSSAVGCIYSPNSIISNNIFMNNVGKYGAIAFAFNSGGTLSGNLIMNNTSTDAAGGLLIDNGSTPLLINNIIVNNKGLNGGLVCYKNGNPVLICNTIVNNIATLQTGGGGIRCLDGSNPILINNILHSNTSKFGKEISTDNSSNPTILYCNIQGGKSGIGGGSYTGLFENNIDVDPLFVNADLNEYGLTDLSPCIGAGIDSIKVDDVWYKTPSSCFNGNPRPSPTGSYPDIGACENPLGRPDFVQLTTHSFMFEGIQRNYNAYLPKNYYGKSKLPLVFNLHGYTLNKVQQMNYSKMNEVADTAGFIVVYPNAVDATWNCGVPGAPNVNDIGFINAIIDTLSVEYSIDESRIYCCGFSRGGFMTNRLACELSDRIAAFAAVAGTMANSIKSSCIPNRHVPILYFHGTDDPIVPYNGNVDRQAVESFITQWSNSNLCTDCDTTFLENLDTLDGCKVQRITNTNTTDSTRVIFYRIVNGGHTWPGGDPNYLVIPGYDMGNTNMDINASELIWKFFSKYKLTLPTNVDIDSRQELSSEYCLYQNYPNPFNPSTTIKYHLKVSTFIRLNIYDILGREVAIPVNENQKPGYYEVEWNASEYPSGVYFYQLRTNDFASTKKLVLLK